MGDFAFFSIYVDKMKVWMHISYMTSTKGKTMDIEIGTGVTLIGYSDRTPFEVVKVVSDKTLEVRRMDAVLDPDWKPDFHVGGFMGHTANQNEQKWNLTSNPSNDVLRIRLGKKGWKDANGDKYSVGKAVKFFDYNF